MSGGVSVPRYHGYTFFLIGFFAVIMSFFLFTSLFCIIIKNIIGIDLFTVFYYIKYNLVILTGVPRISFDM